MRRFMIKHRKGMLFFSRAIFFLFLSLLLVDKYTSVIVTKYISQEFIFVLTFFFGCSWLFFHIRKDEASFKKIWEPYFKYAFLMLLVIIILGNLNFEFLNNLPWFNDISELIKNYVLLLTLFAIGTGFFTFYFNKDRVEKELENEKELEEKTERKKEKEFDEKFKKLKWFDFEYGVVYNWKEKKYFRSILLTLSSPFIYVGRIPYTFFKRMYKEGWTFSIVLIFIVLLFIAIKIGMPLIYDGSYFDEYYHLLSGVEFFKTGHFAEIYANSYYERGPIISILTGLFMFLFKKSIFIAKLLPATIGVINLFLFYKISKLIFEDKKYILLSLAVYTLVPWFIFNHFYIRMYVFNEFFMLLLTVIFISFFKNFDCGKKVTIHLFLSVIIALIIFLFSRDAGRIMLCAYALFFLTYVYFFKIQNISFKSKLFQIYSKRTIPKILIFLIIVFVFFYIEGIYIIKDIISSSLIFTTGENFKYNNFFLSLNTIFTIFFLCSGCFLFFKKIKLFHKFIIISSLLIFFIHYNLPNDLQLTRSIIYFLPIFYLVSIFSISKTISIYKRKIVTYVLILFIIITIYVNYPVDFLNHPYIPDEINYIDNQIYSDIIENCNDSIIITAGYPGIAQFHGINPDFFINVEAEKHPLDFVITEKKEYLEIYSKTPTLVNYEEFLDVLNSNKKLCFFGGELPERYMGLDILKSVQSNMNKFPKKYSSTRRILFYVK